MPYLEERSLTSQESFSSVQLVLLTTVGLLFVTPLLHYIKGVLHRRNSRPRQYRLIPVVEAKDATIDIVAVHGLGAHPEYTWTVASDQAHTLHTRSSANARHTSKKTRINWLKDDGFLKEDFKTARIMTFGYNADWFIGAPMAIAEQRAGTLLRELKRERIGIEGLRPILFIGHSFGGIIIKHAICEAEKDRLQGYLRRYLRHHLSRYTTPRIRCFLSWTTCRSPYDPFFWIEGSVAKTSLKAQYGAINPERRIC